MRISRLTFLACICLVVPRVCEAQTVFEFKFFGSCYTTNRFGTTVRNLVTHYSLVREEAKRLGVSDTSNLALVYKIGGSQFGDTVDLVRKDTGEVLSTVFGFFFGSDASLLRDSMINASGTEEKRLDYIYTRQNSHSLGAAFVTKTGSTLKTGGPDFRVRGEMHYIVTAESTNALRICEGKFMTRAPVTFGTSGIAEPSSSAIVGRKLLEQRQQPSR